jgi:hypothetical protein
MPVWIGEEVTTPVRVLAVVVVVVVLEGRTPTQT